MVVVVDMEVDMLHVEVESYLLQEAKAHVRDIRPSMEVARLGEEAHDQLHWNNSECMCPL